MFSFEEKKRIRFHLSGTFSKLLVNKIKIKRSNLLRFK